MAIGQYADQISVGQLITHQAQNGIPVPPRQQDGPIPAQLPHSGRQFQPGDGVALHPPILDALLEPDYEMIPGIYKICPDIKPERRFLNSKHKINR